MGVEIKGVEYGLVPIGFVLYLKSVNTFISFVLITYIVIPSV